MQRQGDIIKADEYFNQDFKRIFKKIFLMGRFVFRAATYKLDRNRLFEKFLISFLCAVISSLLKLVLKARSFSYFVFFFFVLLGLFNG